MSQVLEQLNTIFRDVFDNPKITVTEATTAADVEEWDSLNHIQVVLAIEKHFKKKFTSQEIRNWKNVGDIVKAVETKLSAA